MALSLTDPERWWIAAAERSYNVHMVTLDYESVRIETVDETDTVIDHVERNVDGGSVRERTA